MKFNKKYNLRTVVVLLIIFLLFTGCNNSHNITDNSVNNQTIALQPQKSVPEEATIENSVTYKNTKEIVEDCEDNIEFDNKNTEPVSENDVISIKQEETDSIDSQLTCTLSIRCDKAVGKSIDMLAEIPGDGVVYEEQTVVFYDGESVFDILLREMKNNKIHLEFANIPIYDSVYIEGINNLYEFDCGELSGWMYKVNGVFPNYGCSHYKLQAGDKVEWVYTCDLGKDVGGEHSARNGVIK